MQLIIVSCHLSDYNHKIVSKKLIKLENYKENNFKSWKILKKQIRMFKNHKIMMTIEMIIGCRLSGPSLN